jgi:uncharacterized protein YpmS
MWKWALLLLLFLLIVIFLAFIKIKITKVAAGFAHRPLNGKREISRRTEPNYTTFAGGFISGGHFGGKGISMHEAV